MTTQSPNDQRADVGAQLEGQSQRPFRPYVTFALIGVSVLLFAMQYLSMMLTGVDILALMGEKINRAIIAGELWRLVTPIFLHASLIHILFNMYFLYAVGPAMELYYGRERYLLLYFLGGVSGNLMSFYLSPNPSLGASTALFGLVAAEGVFIFRNREFFGNRARRMLANTLMIVVVNIMLSMTPGIDLWGHMGGLLGGLAFAWTSGPVLSVRWLPGGGYRVQDQNQSSRFWLAGAFEAAVLLALAFLRIFRGS